MMMVSHAPPPFPSEPVGSRMYQMRDQSGHLNAQIAHLFQGGRLACAHKQLDDDDDDSTHLG